MNTDHRDFLLLLVPVFSFGLWLGATLMRRHLTRQRHDAQVRNLRERHPLRSVR